VIDACREVTGVEIPVRVGERRAGDPPQLVADARRAAKELNWQPQYTDIREIVKTAWDWHRSHPHGYDKA
jgi:UDP-glucose 4-epimerase